MTTLSLGNLKQLTTLQRDECKERAIKRVQRHIGDEPTIEHFQRHIGEEPTIEHFQRNLGRLWTVLDIIAFVVFVPSLLISSIHIITHVGALAGAAFDTLNQSVSGTVFGRDLFVAAHQWLLIPLAEGSMILFLVMFGVSRDGWRRWVYFLLAGLAVLFVLAANLSSGLGLLESVLAPAFTIGIGLKLEHLIMQYLKRGREVTERYLAAIAAREASIVDAAEKYLSAHAVWEAATADATQSPEYRPFLMNELWAALMRPKGNQWAMEASPGFKRAAVERELAQEDWAQGAVQPETTFVANVEDMEEVKPKLVETPFGEGGGLMLDENASMPVMLSANGHTAHVNEN